MDTIYEINGKNLERIGNKRRRLLINRVKNKENLNYLDYKYYEIMKDWIVLKTTMD